MPIVGNHGVGKGVEGGALGLKRIGEGFTS